MTNVLIVTASENGPVPIGAVTSVGILMTKFPSFIYSRISLEVVIFIKIARDTGNSLKGCLLCVDNKRLNIWKEII